jgi:glycosyltransferase involved in cell wall biosynthesis
VIVINDGSPDSDRLEQVIAPDRGRILYLKQENRGAAAARNTGIRHARGTFLAFLDSDDLWLPGYLASQMNLFERIPSLDAVYCDNQSFDDHQPAGKTFAQVFSPNDSVTLDGLITENDNIPFSFSVARKQVIVDAGCFDESLRRCEDYDLWLRVLYRGGQIGYQKEMLGRYRVRSDSLSRDSMKVLEAMLAIYEKAERIMKLSDETRATLQRQIARARANIDLEAGKNFLATGDFGRAIDSLRKANNFFHRLKLKMAIWGLQFAPHWTRGAVRTWQKDILGCG